MQDNIGSLGRDFIADLGFTHTELVGKDIKKLGKILILFQIYTIIKIHELEQGMETNISNTVMQ